MAPPKRKGGRVTPKGTTPGSVPTAGTPRVHYDREPVHAAEASSRYTPPVPKSVKQSPRWVPVLMFALLGLGGLVIMLNYLGILPGAPDNLYLLIGLAMLLGGILVATQYH